MRQHVTLARRITFQPLACIEEDSEIHVVFFSCSSSETWAQAQTGAPEAANPSLVPAFLVKVWVRVRQEKYGTGRWLLCLGIILNVKKVNILLKSKILCLKLIMNFIGYWDFWREEKNKDRGQDSMEVRPVANRARQNLEPVFILGDHTASCWRHGSRGRVESSSRLELGQTLGILFPKPWFFTWGQGDPQT